MSAAPSTKIFGINVGVDPKFILGGLLAVALLVFYLNSRSSSENSSGNTADTRSATPAIAYPGTSGAKTVRRRNRDAAYDRGTLRIRPVDASRGDVDPTLRLDMLARLQTISADTPGRSLFEVGPAAAVPSPEAVAKLNAKIEPAPLPAPSGPPPPDAPVTPQANIPLRYYGYVKAAGAHQHNQGLFMSGDNVVVALEGEKIEQRYLVMELTTTTARMEDTQIRQGQVLMLVPEANQQ